MSTAPPSRAPSSWSTARSPAGSSRRGPNDTRPQFNPHEFVRQGGTLYSLSKEGAGTAGPLVTALTVAVVEAAEEYAKGCPMGRMPNPLVGVLDEAANVCRWKNLPDLYSHFGSRGIVLMTILQSWAQGQECWGEHGMEKLWSAANIRVYGGGASDANFLERLSKLIGDYDIISSSVSYNKGERGTSRQTQRHNIMEVSDLASMPPGRAVVFPSGIPATMVKTVPWFTRPDAGAVKASLTKYDPGCARCDGSARREPVGRGRHAAGAAAPPRGPAESRSGSRTRSSAVDGEQELFYPHVAAFVEDRLIYLYRRRIGQQFIWCPEWYRHAEALQPAGLDLARLGTPAARPGDRDVGLVARPRGPAHDGAARPGRPVRGLPWSRTPTTRSRRCRWRNHPPGCSSTSASRTSAASRSGAGATCSSPSWRSWLP